MSIDHIVDFLKAGFSDAVENLSKPGSSIYVGCLMSSALVAYLHARHKGTAFFVKSKWLSKSMRVDVLFYFINALLFQSAISYVVEHEAAWLQSASMPIKQILSPHLASVGYTAKIALVTLVEVVCYDFCFYWCHFAMHKVPWLWRLHKIHHSATELGPLTGFRNHPVDDVIFSVVTSFGALIGAILMNTIVDGDVEPLTFAGVNGVFFIFSLTAPLRHSNTSLSYGKVLDRVFVSPHQHQVHHSNKPRHWDKNFGLVFSIWDIVFKTHYRPSSDETFTYGLGLESSQYTDLHHLYIRPLAANISVDEAINDTKAQSGIDATQPTTAEVKVA